MMPSDETSPLPPAWLELPDGQIHWIDGTCTLGRLATNHLVLAHPGVSRSHAVLQPDAHGGHILADLRSTNGTYVNGQRLTAATLLHDRDQILLGDIALVYRCNLQHAPAEPGTAAQHTALRVHEGPCWLLLCDVIRFTALTQAVGNAAASQRFKAWLTAVRPCVTRHGGTINSYPGDALFAYWRADQVPPATVQAALRELQALQESAGALPFRFVCHHGTVRLGHDTAGETLEGSAVIFLFRIEKCAKALGHAALLSEAAARALGAGIQNVEPLDGPRRVEEAAPPGRVLGRAEVPDFPGGHTFFGLP